MKSNRRKINRRKQERLTEDRRKGYILRIVEKYGLNIIQMANQSTLDRIRQEK